MIYGLEHKNFLTFLLLQQVYQKKVILHTINIGVDN